MANVNDTSPANEFTPRPPVDDEKHSLLEWLDEQGGDDNATLVERSWIAVFDHYMSDGPGYAGKVMCVIWPAYPNMVSVFLWVKGKMEHLCTHE